MDEHRTILIVFSAVCGCILLVLALWRVAKPNRTHGHSRWGWTLWIYGGLFLVASLILWKRENIATVGQTIPHSNTVSVPPAASNDSGTKADSSLPRFSADVAAGNTKTDVFQDSPLMRRETAFVDEKVSPRYREFPRLAAKRSLNMNPAPRASTPLPRPVEDIIYTAVSGTFDIIENWFARYGTAVVLDETNRGRGINDRDSSIEDLPPIFFAPNTAELTPESASVLQEVADLLKSRADVSVIEIQARTESTGPEPYNNILTQARAEVVRDFLMREGINTERLIARAMGSGGADSSALRSHIRFVVQP